jgi:hypothetical protein
VNLSSLLLLCTAFTQPTAPWPPLERADWDAFSYEVLPDEGHGDFVVAGQLRALGANAHGRLLLCLSDEDNHYAVDITPGGIQLLRVESGLALPIGTGEGVGVRGRKWHDFILRREAERLCAFIDGELVASAPDGTFPGGRIAFGSRGGSLSFRDLLVQDTASPLFEDDFMRAEGETGGWEIIRGNWKVQSIGSPVRSNNAFNFTSGGARKGAVAIAGDWFWHDYEVSASCQSHGEGRFGLYAHYVSPKDHLLFVCGQASGKQGAVAQLLGVTHGKLQTLASEPIDVAYDQWYRLALRIEGQRLVGSIDGRPIVVGATEITPGGRVGLYAQGPEGSTFDDFAVRQSARFAMGTYSGAAWRPVGGEWEAVDGVAGEAPKFRGRSSSEAELLYGERLPDDMTLRARVSRPQTAEIGLVAGWTDGANYWALTYGGSPARLRLARVTDGQTAALAEEPVETQDEEVELELSLRGRTITGRALGATALRALQGASLPGWAGLLVRDGEATFESVALSRPGLLPEVAHFEGTFAQEVSMADWAAENSDWMTIAEPGSQGTPSYWHRAPAYGDLDLSAKLAGPVSGPVSVMAAAEEPGSESAYCFSVSPGVRGAASLRRAGVEVATEKLPDIAAEGICEVGLRKEGPFVVGSLNRQPLVSFADPSPLPGLHAGFAAPPEAADPAGTIFRAENVVSYSFRRAPADWWVGSGDWKVTNRWDCEPRWTFFIGQSDSVACLWHKREFGPDVTLDFYAATRFDSTKGYQYSYAADLNCTIAADGHDLTSGYSFMFGGWDNQYTRLLRGDQVLAETTDLVIPRSSSIHRRWFNLRIQKAGQRIRCWMDGAPVFDVTDPDPLNGSRVALWTYNNGMAVARVRIASSEIRPAPPTPPDGGPRCPYDAIPVGASDG